MRKLIQALPLLLVVCGDLTPAYGVDDPTPTVEDVVRVMSRLPEERCLFNRGAKGCDRPGGYDKGPDARRIAAGIAAHANGALTGTRREDAAVMATFTSYESGNNADAKGDCDHDRTLCKAHGPFQLWYVSEEVATDPDRAPSVWLSIAVSSMNTASCAKNPPDERLAGLAGSCVYPPARTKVRQRLQAARDALVAP